MAGDQEDMTTGPRCESGLAQAEKGPGELLLRVNLP